MFATKLPEPKTRLSEKYAYIAKKMRESKEAEISISSAGSDKPEKIKMVDLISDAQKKNRVIIVSITPGPVKDIKDLPKTWMYPENEAAQGCSVQLNAADQAWEKLNGDVYGLNNKTSEYQCGPDGLVAAKKYKKLRMISDADQALKTAWELPTIQVEKKDYLARLTVVLMPDGMDGVFELDSPVNEHTAKDHVTLINNFMSPVLKQEHRRSPSPIQSGS